MVKILTALIFSLSTVAFAQDIYDLPDGTRIQAYLALPESGQGPYPLVIVMGGGPGSYGVARRTFENMGQEFLQRGWAVASPISPGNQSFWGQNAGKVRQLVGLLQQNEQIDDAPALLAGISNGGISAIEIAANSPDEYRGVIAVPGLVSGETNLGGLRNFPVYLRIGSEDRLGWGDIYPRVVNTLNNASATVNAQLLQGTGHTFPLDWTSLEPWLSSLESP